MILTYAWLCILANGVKDKVTVSHKCLRRRYLSFYLLYVSTWIQRRRPLFTFRVLLIRCRLTIKYRPASLSARTLPSSDSTNLLCTRDSGGCSQTILTEEILLRQVKTVHANTHASAWRVPATLRLPKSVRRSNQGLSKRKKDWSRRLRRGIEYRANSRSRSG